MATVSATSPPLLCSTNRRACFSNKPSLSSRPKTQFCTQKPFSGALDSQTRPSQPPNSKLKPHMCRADRPKYTTTVQQENDGLERLLRLLYGLLRESTFCGFFSFLMLLCMSEGLFNFVIEWTFMFCSSTVHRSKEDRHKWSLDALRGFQMFLTITFLIPYMATRLNETEPNYTPSKGSQLGSVMTNGASIVGLASGAICLISALWALFGRIDGNFGSISERREFLIGYLGSERLAYAFIWDICPYLPALVNR